MNKNICEMQRHLPKIEIDRLQCLADIKKQYALGTISLEEAKRQLKEKVGKLRPYHYALMEQTMTEENPEECFKENLSELNKLLEEMMDYSIPTLPDDHPIRHYYRENEEMRSILNAAEDLVQYPVIKNQWLELLDKASAYLIHYTRKQNQLYPILEKKGFDRPTVTMWTFDDMISNSVKKLRPLLEANDEEAFIAQVKELIPYLRDLMDKEEAILYPTSLALINEEEFEEMKSGDQEIGFAFIDVAKTEKKDNIRPADGFAQELQSLLMKYGYAVGHNQPLDVTTGKLTLEQINLIYQHLPFDISFVNEDELVQFYSDTDHRIFPRSKNVIGRKVENCHPRKSVHIVREIVEKMRSGEQSKAEFWINKPNLFIYITYYAVRDKQGTFRGILEVMQDCTRIRSLTGSQTLLTWADEEKKSATSPPTATMTDSVEAGKDNNKQVTEITEDTMLKDLFSQYPGLKEALAQQYAPFKMLQTALGKLILKKATIKMAGERSGLGTQKLITMIRQTIRSINQS